MSTPAEPSAVAPADDAAAVSADDRGAVQATIAVRSSRLIPSLPKVLLHDHLDGGLRPQSMIEMAAEVGHELPATDADALSTWFYEAASSGTLPRYLETFDHTIAVMQTEEHLRRVARESAIDLAADGVVYAEQRYAPEQHLRNGLSLQQVVDAVQAGFAEGVAEAAAQGSSIRIGTLVTAMRHADRWDEIAELTLANRDNGVVGFDIAGAEDGFPPSRHISRVRARCGDANFPATVHAGEAAGLASIAEAVHLAQAAAHRPRRAPHRRRVDRRAGRPARPAGALGPRPAHPARAVPLVERADRRRALGRRAPGHPPASSSASPSP